MKLVDLRGNKIGKGAIRILAEALERAERVRHVYVHAGGKIEALGSAKWAAPRDGSSTVQPDSKGVETICVVDIRDNKPEQTSFPYELNTVENSPGLSMNPASNVPGSFNPLQLLEQSGVPKRNALANSHSEPTLRKKDKEKGKLGKSVSGIANEMEMKISEAEKKKAKMKAHTDRLMALKEAQWQGRAGVYYCVLWCIILWCLWC